MQKYYAKRVFGYWVTLIQDEQDEEQEEEEGGNEGAYPRRQLGGKIIANYLSIICIKFVPCLLTYNSGVWCIVPLVSSM